MLSFVITFFSWYLAQFLRQETKFLRQKTKSYHSIVIGLYHMLHCFFVTSTVFGFSLDISQVFVKFSIKCLSAKNNVMCKAGSTLHLINCRTSSVYQFRQSEPCLNFYVEEFRH